MDTESRQEAPVVLTPEMRRRRVKDWVQTISIRVPLIEQEIGVRNVDKPYVLEAYEQIESLRKKIEEDMKILPEQDRESLGAAGAVSAALALKRVLIGRGILIEKDKPKT